VLEQTVQQDREAAGQLVTGILDKVGIRSVMCARLCGTSRPNPPNEPRIWLACAVRVRTNPRPNPVHPEHRLLLPVLDRHQARGGTGHGLADGLGARRTVFVAPDVRLDALRRPQSRLVGMTSPAPRAGTLESTPILLGSDQKSQASKLGGSSCNYAF
jgi:hypothetical protein